MAIAKAPELYHASYATKAKTAAISPSLGQQIALFQSRVINGSGSALDLGILRKLAPESWSMYKVAASTTDVTATVQAGSSVTLFESNNHGFIVAANRRFNLIGLNVTTADSGSPVYELSYWNGSSWTAISGINVPTSYGLDTNLVVFSGPVDWDTGTDVVGVADGKWAIRVLSTTAPSSGVVIDDAWSAAFMAYQESVVDSGYLQIKFSNEKPLILQSGEGLLPYFGNSENEANVVEAYYSHAG